MPPGCRDRLPRRPGRAERVREPVPVPCLGPIRQPRQKGEETALSREGLGSNLHCYQRQDFRREFLYLIFD